MFQWLFGKKKKLNKNNVSRKAAMLTKIEGLSRKQRVRKLRALKGIHTYVPDFDYMYTEDMFGSTEGMLEDFIMLYLLMDMVDVVSEEEAGFYEVEDSMVEAEVSPEGTVGQEVDADLEETPEVETTDNIVEEVAEVPSIFAEGGALDMTKVDDGVSEGEPTPIAVEEPVVETAPVIEEPVAQVTMNTLMDDYKRQEGIGQTEDVAEKAETFADNYEVKDTGSSSFGDDYTNDSDSGSSYDSSDSGDCGGSDD